MYVHHEITTSLLFSDSTPSLGGETFGHGGGNHKNWQLMKKINRSSSEHQFHQSSKLMEMIQTLVDLQVRL